jgi:thiol-disulfide isomerase/thioredoxin
MKAALAALLILVSAASAAAADPVSEFSLPDLDGKTHRLTSYRGKWIIINYWATDCPPCLKEIPELERFHQNHKDKDAVVVGVNYEDIKLTWLKDFVKSVKMTYPVLLTEPGTVTPFGPIKILPTTIIVSPQGELMGAQAGAVTEKMIDQYIREHSAAAPKNATVSTS